MNVRCHNFCRRWCVIDLSMGLKSSGPRVFVRVAVADRKLDKWWLRLPRAPRLYSRQLSIVKLQRAVIRLTAETANAPTDFYE